MQHFERTQELKIPRPPKCREDFGKLQRSVMVLHAKGFGVTEISAAILTRYNISLGHQAVEDMLEKITPGLTAWQGRRLCHAYAGVYIIKFPVRIKRGSRSKTKKACVLLGWEADGGRLDTLGLWLANGFDALFWNTVLSELQARGLWEIGSIVCTKSKELTVAAQALFPNAEIISDAEFFRRDALTFSQAVQATQCHPTHAPPHFSVGAQRLDRFYSVLRKVALSDFPYPNDDAIRKALFWRVMEWEASMLPQA